MPSDESLIRDALRLESQGRYHVQIVVRNLILFAVGGSCSEKPNNYSLIGFDWPLSPLADIDHFVDVNEMILDAVPTVKTRQIGLLNYRSRRFLTYLFLSSS